MRLRNENESLQHKWKENWCNQSTDYESKRGEQGWDRERKRVSLGRIQ